MTSETNDTPAVANPFAGDIAPQTNAVSEAVTQREYAEVQAAMAIAQRFPRNQLRAMDAIINACSRPTLAESALYSYSRGGTEITGPSIRMAEALAQAWGNIQFGVRELDQRHGESTVEAYAWDLESNTRQSKVFQVKHIRHTRKGAYSLEDPRDVYELVANQGARRLRACILGVIPGDVIDAAVRQCETTMKSRVEVTPDLIKSLVDKFAEHGVTRRQIETRIQRSLESITPAQVVNLGKVYNSIKDGMSTAADWFRAEETDKQEEEPGSAAREALRKRGSGS
jgi:hypothetical protein